MPATVLVVDDAAQVRSHVTQGLHGLDTQLRVLTAEDGLRGFIALKKNSVDVILCDINMPHMDGFKFLELVRKERAFDACPVILLTGVADLKDKLRGFALGAADYIIKPFHAEELRARVQVHLKVRALQAELEEKNGKLQAMVREDALTGLKNRRALNELLHYEFAQAERYRTPFALAMVDIDHFKRINDNLGHPAGDRLLRAVAECLSRTARVQDSVVRYGGEEFAILMPHTDLAGARLAAERHRVKVAAIAAATWEGEGDVRASFGVACAPRADIASADELVVRADSALYRAKQEGRNCVRFDAEPAP